MKTSQEKRAILKQLIQGPGVVVAPGCGDALGGRLVQEAGFDAVYMSGYAVEATYGLPDVGQLTLVEMAGRAAAICDVTSRQDDQLHAHLLQLVAGQHRHREGLCADRELLRTSIVGEPSGTPLAAS